ncbi:MAG: helix-turn-helix domain-containing protein [Pseudomonadota bacterium]
MPKQVEDRDIGKEILDGVRSIKTGKTGRIPTVPGVAEIRAKTALSESQFAKLLNVSVRTLQEWEQGRRAPPRPAKTLLAIAHQNPQALLDVAV